MKNILFLLFITLCWACDNEVSTVGDELIRRDSYIETRTYRIPTSTVKLDSFPTSTGYTSSTLKALLIGRTKDPITGETVATPYFELVPSGGTRVDNAYVYDSITFNAVFNKTVWGDTTDLQHFYVYRLSEIADLDPETDLMYNNDTVPCFDEPIGTYATWAMQERLGRFQIRLNDSLGVDLFNKLRDGDFQVQKDIDFIRYFSGVALVSDPSNTCILGINPSPDSLGIKLHFHSATSDLTYSFNKSSNYSQYTFMNLTNYADGTPYEALKDQSDNLDFADAKRDDAVFGQTVTQGISGYMIKLRLPIAPAGDKYKTIVKAEIELHPQQYINMYYPLPTVVNMYKSDGRNNPLTAVTNAAGAAVTGRLVMKPNRPGEETYVLNITDYYNTLCQQTDADRKNDIIISMPLSEMHSNFARLTVDENPTLKVYYAQYE